MADISSPEVRALRDQLVSMQARIDRLEKGSRATQLGNSSIEDGYLLFNGGDGSRLRVGKQPDGKFGWGAANVDPPPAPNTPELVGTSSGVSIRWNGEFHGIKPSDFVHVVAYLSPGGNMFVHSDANAVGTLIGAGELPVTAIGGNPLTAGTSYWCRLVAINSSGLVSEPSFTAGPVQPQPVVATELLEGVVENVNLAIDAVEAANIAAGAVGETEIAPDSVHTPHVVARAIDTLRIAVQTIQADNMATDSVDARIIRALAIVSDHIDVNAVNAGHIQAGAVTADKLAAVLVLASQVIAGDPDDWHLELGDAQTPILYWDGEDTGFAVSRDQATGQSNVYLSGRVEFGNGSQIEQDYLDLHERPSSGFQTPKPRQLRSWIQSAPSTGITARWTSATQPGSLCLMAVFQVGVPGPGAPNCGTPDGAEIIFSFVDGNTRLTLFQVPDSPTSRSTETFGSSAGAARWAIVLAEYSGINATALDVYAFNSGTGPPASSGTTDPTSQADELQFAVFGSGSIGFTNGQNGQWNNPTNGFTKLIEGDGTGNQGIAVFTKNATGTAAAETTVTPNKTVPWQGIIATFRDAVADGVPVPPSPATTRLFTLARGGKSTPHVVDDTGAIYPVGRIPYCRVYCTANFTVAAADIWAQSGWAIGLDPYSMAALSASPSTYTNITIPVGGMYLVDYKAIFQTSTNTNNLGGCFVAKNNRVVGNSVARDVRNFAQTNSATGADLDPGDKTPVQATRIVPLDTGDVLYWGNWSNATATVFAGLSNIPTEITVTYLGPA